MTKLHLHARESLTSIPRQQGFTHAYGAHLFTCSACGNKQHPLIQLHLFRSRHHAWHQSALVLHLLLKEGCCHADHDTGACRLGGHIALHHRWHLYGLVGVGWNNSWSCARQVNRNPTQHSVNHTLRLKWVTQRLCLVAELLERHSVTSTDCNHCQLYPTQIMAHKCGEQNWEAKTYSIHS